MRLSLFLRRCAWACPGCSSTAAEWAGGGAGEGTGAVSHSRGDHAAKAMHRHRQLLLLLARCAQRAKVGPLQLKTPANVTLLYMKYVELAQNQLALSRCTISFFIEPLINRSSQIAVF